MRKLLYFLILFSASCQLDTWHHIRFQKVPMAVKKPDIPDQQKNKKIMPTKLYWKIKTDYPAGEEIEALHLVLVDGKAVSPGATISPGAHTITIRQPAYSAFSRKIEIPKGISIYTFEATLISLPRLVEQAIGYDVEPATKNYQVSFTNLDSGKTFKVEEGAQVKPGSYEIEVEQTAFHSIHIKKRIFPATSPFKIEETLEAKTRIIHAKIDFDIPTGNNLPPHLLSFIDLQTGVRRLVRPGGKIKPGKYQFIVEKPGYKMATGAQEINILPTSSPFIIQAVLQAQPRRVSFEMIYQNNLQQAEQILINKEIYSFQKLYGPGDYQATATFKEFQNITKKFTIPPGVGVHVISMKLVHK